MDGYLRPVQFLDHLTVIKSTLLVCNFFYKAIGIIPEKLRCVFKFRCPNICMIDGVHSLKHFQKTTIQVIRVMCDDLRYTYVSPDDRMWH